MNARQVRRSNKHKEPNLSLEGLEDLLERPSLIIAEAPKQKHQTLTNEERKRHTSYCLDVIRQLHEMQDLLTESGTQLTIARNKISDLNNKLEKQSKLLAYQQSLSFQLGKLLTTAIAESERLKNQWLCRSWLK
jgi:hypothetical protein